MSRSIIPNTILAAIGLMLDIEAVQAGGVGPSCWERFERVMVYDAPWHARYPSITKTTDGSLLVFEDVLVGGIASAAVEQKQNGVGVGIRELADSVPVRVPRTDRGRALTHPQQGRLWRTFEDYVDALREQGKREWLTIIQETRRFLEEWKPTLSYRAIVVGEAQDFHPRGMEAHSSYNPLRDK